MYFSIVPQSLIIIVIILIVIIIIAIIIIIITTITNYYLLAVPDLQAVFFTHGCIIVVRSVCLDGWKRSFVLPSSSYPSWRRWCVMILRLWPRLLQWSAPREPGHGGFTSGFMIFVTSVGSMVRVLKL